MSDFSSVYYLKSEEIEDAIDILNKSKLRGYILQPTNKFIPMLIEDTSISELKPSKNLMQNNKSIILHISNCEDHGFEFSIFELSNKICYYGIFWEYRYGFSSEEEMEKYYENGALHGNPIEIDSENFNIDAFEKLGFSKSDLEKIKNILFPKGINTKNFNSDKFVKEFCEYIGLSHYRWSSFNYYHDSFNEDDKSIFIDKK